MRKHLFTSFVVLLSVTRIFSQTVPVPDTLVILGMDFSHAKIVTNHTYVAEDVIRYDIPRLNAEIIKLFNQHKDKIRSKHLLIDTTSIHTINSGIDPSQLFAKERFQFQGGDTLPRNIIKKYNTSGYGKGKCHALLFVMEKVDEIDDRESFYIVMFETDTKKIIHCDKVERGLSMIKNQVGSGWFSWKTGFHKTISSFDHVYDFWNSYPETKMVDIRMDAPKPTSNDSIHPEGKDSLYTMKGTKIIRLSGAITLLGDDIAPEYSPSFRIKYGASNIYSATGASSSPKVNLSFEYGFSRKQTAGVTFGYDRAIIRWGDTAFSTVSYADTWNRYQLALKWNYYFVRMPVMHLFTGVQIGYNLFQFSSTAPQDKRITTYQPLPITFQLQLGMTFYIKQKTGINFGGSLGFGSNDYFTLGICRKIAGKK